MRELDGPKIVRRGQVLAVNKIYKFQDMLIDSWFESSTFLARVLLYDIFYQDTIHQVISECNGLVNTYPRA
jgi:hypothetical protein